MALKLANPSEVQGGKDKLKLGVTANVVPPDQAEVKAQKIDFVLGEDSPGTSSISAQLQNGYEDRYRDLLAQRKANRLQKAKLGILSDLVATQKGPITKLEEDFVLGMQEADLAELNDTKNILETEYAKKFLTTVIANDEDNSFEETQKEDPEGANDALDRAEYGVARAEIVHTLLDDVERRINKQSWLGATLEVAERFIPVWSDMRFNDLLKQAPTTSVLPGSNLEQQYRYLHTLPPKDFREQLEEAYNDIASRNVYMAKEFLQGAITFGTSDKFLNNAFPILDLADIASLGAGTAIAIGRTAKGAALTQKLKGALKASVFRKPNVTTVAQQVGNLNVAAVSHAAQSLKAKLFKAPIKDIDKIEAQVPSIANPRQWFTGNNNLARNVQQDLEEASAARVRAIEDILTDVPTVQRTLDERIAEVAQKVFDEEIVGKFRGIQRAILDVGNTGIKNAGSWAKGWGYARRPSEELFTNTEQIYVHVGRMDGSLFSNRTSAEAWAKKRLGDKIDWEVVDVPGGNVIEITKDLPETIDQFRNLRVPLENKSNASWFNAVVGIARTPKDVLSKSNNVARLAVTHGTQKMYELVHDIVAPIGKLKGDQFDEFNIAIKANRDSIDPITGERGFYFKTQFDMEQYWTQKFGHTPSPDQINAYNAYVQFNDLDHVIRVAGQYRDLVRLGVKDVEFEYVYKKVSNTTSQFQNMVFPVKVTDPAVRETVKFQGKEVEDIIDYSHPTNLAIYDSANRNVNIINTKHSPIKAKEQIEDLRKQGWRLIQVADANLKLPDRPDLQGIGYVLTNDVKMKRLSINSSYRPGGHVINRFEFYAKQPHLTNTTTDVYYSKDLAVFGAQTQAQANKMVKLWNEARIMLRDGDPNLDQFVSSQLAMDPKDFKAKFKPSKNRKGETVPGLDVNVPITVTKSGQRATETYNYANDYVGKTFHDTQRSPHNLYTEMNRSFLGERDSNNLAVYEEENNLLDFNDDGDLLDPLDTIVASARNIVDLRMKRDYTIKSANDWLEQFRDVIKGDYNVLQRSPIDALYNAEFLESADFKTVRNAKLVKRQIINFLSAMNKEETIHETLKQKMRDFAYDAYGKKGLDVVENYMLPVVANPLTAARTVAFHAKMGLFNPTQLFTQAQGMANAVAIAGRDGLKGSMAMPLMRLSYVNRMSLDTAAKWSTKFGWKEDEFKEMFGVMLDTGWHIVKGDYGLIDDIADPPIFNGKVGKTLDAGLMFFTEGEKWVRYTSWASAYSEWRKANPKAVLNRKAIGAIMDRADNLNVNMSAANNAVWQRGPLAIPAQFMAFQARLTELYLSKRLTGMEKARLFGMHSLLYGVPTAAGGYFGVWPIYESVKSYLVENQIPHDDNALELVVRGVPALIGEAIGIDADVSAKYGAGGVNAFRDLYRDGDFMQFVLGASGTVVGDMIASPVGAAFGVLGSVLSGQPTYYDFGIGDLINATKNVTTVNNSLKLWYALNTNKWITKNGGVVDDEVGAGEALFMALTGASTQEISRAYTVLEVLKDKKNFIKQVEESVRKDFRKAMSMDDPDDRSEAMKKAWAHATAGGLTPDEFQRVMRQVLMEDSLVDSAERRLQEDFMKRQGLE